MSPLLAEVLEFCDQVFKTGNYSFWQPFEPIPDSSMEG